MMIDTPIASFQRLNAIGLISEEQCSAALAHPKRGALGATASPARCLAWMIEQRILSFADLDNGPVDIPDEIEERYEDERTAVLGKAFTEIDKIGPQMNADLIDELVRDGLVTDSERNKAVSAPFCHILDTPAQALAQVIVTNAFSQADVDAMLARTRAEQGCAGTTDRVRLVEDAAGEIEGFQRMYGLLSKSQRPKLHGGLRLLRGGAVLACAYLLYQFMTAVPGCGSPAITKSIQSMLHSAVRGADPASRIDFPKLTHITEVGHAWARRQRGCTADVIFNGESLPYTYIVGPLPNRKNKVGFTGANREIVEARFSNIGYDGDFGNKAEPIGRDRLEAAFRAGVANSSDGRPRFLPKDAVDDVMDLFSPVSQDRMREIAEIEPLGACRPIQSEIRYACRVMIEHNDPVRAMMGQLPRLLEAEFTFERDAGAEQWRMSNDFRYLFDRAVAEGRPDTRATRSAR